MTRQPGMRALHTSLALQQLFYVDARFTGAEAAPTRQYVKLARDR